MSMSDRLAKLKDQVAKLKQQLPPVAEKVRAAKAALPKVVDPIARAKQALEAAAGAHQDAVASLHKDIESFTNSLPDINKAVADATNAVASGQQSLQDALKENAAGTQQQLLANIQSSLPTAALTDAKAKIDSIKDRLDKAKDTVSRLNLDSVAAQVPALSDLVGQSLQKMSAVQNPLTQALGALSAASGTATDPQDVAAKLAKVQDQATAIGKHISNVSSLMAKGAVAVPATKQHVDQIQQMISAAPGPDTFSNLNQLVDQAVSTSGASDEIAAAAAKFAGFSAMAEDSNSILQGLAGADLLPDVKNKVTQVKGALDQVRQQLPNASSLIAEIASRTGDISGQVKKAKGILGNIARGAGGPSAEQIGKIQDHVQALQQKFGDTTKTLSGATSALPDLKKKFGQATQLMAALRGGGSEEVTGAALKQFQGLVGEISQSDAIAGLSGGVSLGELDGHLKGAQQALNQVLGGQLPASAKGAVSQLQNLIGDAAKHLPVLSSALSKGGGGFGDIAAHIENAKGLASSFSPDFVKQLGSSSQVKDLLGKASAQFPGASQAVSQVTKALPQMQESVGKVRQLFGDITSGKVSTGAALQQLANSPEAQAFLKHADDISGASSLISEAGKNLPQLQQRISQASALMNSLQNGDFSSAESGQAFNDMKAAVAGAAKSELGKHLSSALGAAGGLSESVTAIQSALRQIGLAQPGASDLLSSLGDAGSQIHSITSSITQASDSFGSLASHLQSANGSAAGLTAAFAEQLAQSAQLNNLMDKAQQQFPEAAKLVADAAAALPQLQEKFAQGQQMLNGVMSGTVKPEDLVKQLSSSPEFQGVLKAAQDQFPQAAAPISKANEMLPQLQQGLDSAKDVAANLQKGDLTAALGSLQSSPQAQALLGEAAKQFPEAAAALQQAQAVAAQAQQGFNQAKGALDDLQKGDYQAALGKVTAIPAVQNLLGEAQKQFPEAAALVSQAAAALPQIKEGLAQANQAMAAMQSGDYGAALAQLKTMPAVQNLLAEAQKQFPQVAALADQAQQGLAAVQDGLAQADGLMTAYQNGDTAAALAQLQSIPAVQNLLGAAEQQFPEAAAMLSQATAVLPQVQQHLDQASALMDAAVAGDLNQLSAVQESAAAAETAVATAAATEAASSSESSSSSSSSSSAAAASSSTAADNVQEDAAAEEPGDDDAEGEKLLTISTPLGDDKFDVVNLRGEEKISALFSYRVEVTSQDEAIDFTQIVGQSVTVYLDLGEDDPRNINGIVTRIVQAGTDDDDNTTYVLEMRPWLWKLTKAADCRIYQSQSAVDIITGLFDELGFSDYENSTTGTYTARDYCVQYRESAFNFVSRLMEEEGIFYFFKHEDGKHTLVLADDSDSYPDCPVSEIEFDPTDSPFEDEIFKLSFEQEITTAKYAVDDFSFETSTTDLMSTAEGDGMRWYEYPGGFSTTDDGSTVANKRLAAVEAGAKVLRGASTVRVLTAGCKFTLTQHVRESMNVAYVVRKVSVKCDQQKYGDTFEAIPADVVFRPPLITPKPIIHGSQTAIVVGKSGEEIWVDKYGRVKVQFHWDQLGKNDENSSCWVRVAQGWAGKSWGMIFLPRIGDEVVVSFLEGSPDRPLITGSVYNAQSTVPYTLPDDQTKSTIKTMSSKQGSAGNEIRFQDLKDSEELYLHAQKDMNVLVEHDWIKHVKNSEQTYVQSADPTADTDFKHVLVVDGKRKVTIKGDANEETHTNEGKFTQTVTKEFTLTVNGDTLTITASGDLSIKGKTVTIESSSGDVTIKSAANLTAQAAQSLTNKSGTDLTNQAGTSLTNKSGTDLTNQAGTSLTNKASISMTNDGGAQLTNKASATQECDGGGMLTLKGGMVKLN
ncbi:MAG TPA: type VI secretion system tip protein TssI/VgrG [Terriglobia bacterium]|jgi:type VI secretion system secreted protein VgrG